MFVEQVFQLASQGDADAAISVPVVSEDYPMALVAIGVRLTAVSGTPSAVTLDANLTDGTTTKVPLLGQSIGTAAGQVTLKPSKATKLEGDHYVPQVGASEAPWRLDLDFNFTGGSTPDVSGFVVVRWQY